ncbi:MAG: hypothetical protein J3Q66DRAFT_426383 [Benniella sp.]|nr:MAG: hypothetical protein J3Q66DRAFT_426383 [Benniella sp.]
MSATFFIVGSRVLEYPDILKEQVEQGHHIAMHSNMVHAGLTTLTNEQIVAEIRWSEKIIRDVTGLTMKYVRPPYGDVDNRVREILRQMGYTTVIWTLGWDTNDWRVAKHQIQTSEIIKTFQNALDNRALIRSPTTGQLAGPITLEHNLTDGTIGLSKQILPMAMDRGLKPMSLSQCLGDDNPYQGGASGGAQKQTKSGGANHGIAPMNDSNSTVSGPGKGNLGAIPVSKGDSKSVSGDGSRTKSDASVPVIQNGLQILSYAAMGLTLVASYMLTL